MAHDPTKGPTVIGFDENTGRWFKEAESDIVERLRHPMVMATDVNGRTYLSESHARLDMLEAADTIEKLRLEVVALLNHRGRKDADAE